MHTRSVYLVVLPDSENEHYLKKREGWTLRFKVEVNQREGYHNHVESMRYRCETSDGQILWVPLDAMRDLENGFPIKDQYFDDQPRPWEVPYAPMTEGDAHGRNV